MLCKPWTLPVDTVMAVWHSAYPFFLANLTDEGGPPGDIQKPPRTYLDEPGKMADWMRRKFESVHKDGKPMGAEFMPPDGMNITVWRGLSDTYVVHRHGLTLPHPDTAAPGVDDLPQAKFDEALAEHLDEWGVADAETGLWSLRGTQLDLLRACVSLATVRFWRAGPQMPEPQAFHRAVLDLYRDENGVAFSDAALRVVRRADMEDGKVGGVPYRNTEDGAGLFTSDGYALAVPPPAAPHQPGWGVEFDERGGISTAERGAKAMMMYCAVFVYARYDYATPCCCNAPVAGAGHDARPNDYPPS